MPGQISVVVAIAAPRAALVGEPPAATAHSGRRLAADEIDRDSDARREGLPKLPHFGRCKALRRPSRHANRPADPLGDALADAPRRGGRVVDRAALEMRSTRKRTGGSNPSLSAKTPEKRQQNREIRTD